MKSVQVIRASRVTNKVRGTTASRKMALWLDNLEDAGLDLAKLKSLAAQAPCGGHSRPAIDLARFLSLTS